MFGHVVNGIVGALLWGLANAVYYDLKRKGIRNFGRFAAFWVGNPTTWITFFAVKEGRQPTFDRPEDEDTLLAEIRRDRALRPSETQRTPGATDGRGETPRGAIGR